MPTKQPVPAKAIETPRASSDHLARAREVKAQRAIERAKAEIDAKRAELERLRQNLDAVGDEYDKAMTAANRSKGFDKKLWDKADTLQARYLGMTNRIRSLEKELSQ